VRLIYEIIVTFHLREIKLNFFIRLILNPDRNLN